MSNSEALRRIEEAARKRSSRLDLSGLTLEELPSDLFKLTNLQTLYLSGTGLTALPADFGKLTNLKELYLNDTGLTALPADFGKLTNLKRLSLSGTGLTALPADFGKLTNLQGLSLSRTGLTALPADFGKLTNLQVLDLSGTGLTALPADFGKLTNLQVLDLSGTPLASPPPEIIEQGTKAILAFLRSLMESSRREWVSKLLLVGEGSVGKSSLLRSLRGEPFREEETTHGIEIKDCALDHPTERDVTMTLAAWDFGGQEIYHATHQFFLTNRSLFVLVWNARVGYEQSKIDYWLETIQARAPESPILIVATRIDERSADLPLADLQRKFPQVVGLWKVSNKDGVGIGDLKASIAAHAARLPLMGERWPTTWLDAANAVRARSELYLTPQQLGEIMAAHSVPAANGKRIALWLHELGDLLYFPDNEELRDYIILKPQWISREISKVLDCREVRDQKGIFKHQDRERLWGELHPGLRELFLRLMEQFDLSYQTLENQDLSLVVELLPFNRAPYETRWRAFREDAKNREVAMTFELPVTKLPPGIPTWFLARSHRFTQNQHWRYGALFGDHRTAPEHLGLVEALPSDRKVRLTVRGPYPVSFFSVLRDGLELTLRRYPGLTVTRKIPCPGHNGQPCPHEFDLEHLRKATDRKPPKKTIECPEGLDDVPVSELLFGLDWRTNDLVIDRIDRLETHVDGRLDDVREDIRQSREELRALATYLQREFTRAYVREQKIDESYCPAVFVVRPKDRDTFWQKIKQAVAPQAELQLYCDAPGRWHPTLHGGRYTIAVPAEWHETVMPYLRGLLKALKYAAPLVSPVLGYALPDLKKLVENDITLMKALVEKLPDLEASRRHGLDGSGERWPDPAQGAALRALRAVLDQVDPAHTWGGLRKVLTPEGDYLWLCEEHAQEYRV